MEMLIQPSRRGEKQSGYHTGVKNTPLPMGFSSARPGSLIPFLAELHKPIP